MLARELQSINFVISCLVQRFWENNVIYYPGNLKITIMLTTFMPQYHPKKKNFVLELTELSSIFLKH